ncbi:hypothetical protein LTR02_005981 [Friedmanniomyces endolithicus]|nr:hypothetical protein LTR75_006693 [Friedmanniomyces endolithicus]KAK0845634.1 hypothetical protein LTR03_007382 [Friedmanniomyces endolithicus]KAK0906076.1 hypothetical protein LTR57_017979 [Friedmanniomyces endolithicus]KAK0906495.1 hypothetical protein LTR02_005981 [Friedmanniomyces endolithicus]KAK1030530.1 hypothetical protein LTS16_018822 [Friedmanniomyces endolithicus]
MGIPFSKQINAAFEEVTPLVAAGFEVLQTTKNIALLAAALQVFTGLILSLVLLVLIALLITVNPNLTEERDALVTPVWLLWDLRRRISWGLLWTSRRGRGSKVAGVGIWKVMWVELSRTLAELRVLGRDESESGHLTAILSPDEKCTVALIMIDENEFLDGESTSGSHRDTISRWNRHNYLVFGMREEWRGIRPGRDPPNEACDAFTSPRTDSR